MLSVFINYNNQNKTVSPVIFQYPGNFKLMQVFYQNVMYATQGHQGFIIQQVNIAVCLLIIKMPNNLIAISCYLASKLK